MKERRANMRQTGVSIRSSGRRWLCLLLLIICVLGLMPARRVEARTIKPVETEVHDIFVDELGYNEAAACAALANMQYESAFNPHLLGDKKKGVYTSYGLCQWHNDRWRKLIKFCEKNGYDYTTPRGQMYYLQYELEHMSQYRKVYQALRNAPNTANGAYNAAYTWCVVFEVPANKFYKGMQRGKLAANTYWKTYGKGGTTTKTTTSTTAAKTTSTTAKTTASTKTTTTTTAAQNPNGTVAFRRVLKASGSPYMKGDDVKYIQNCLRYLGYKITADGSFGPGTSNIIKQFQKDHSLSVDGKCGQQTWNAIVKAMEKRNTTKLAITKQPADVIAKSGTKVSFTVEAEGEGLSYQWEYSCTSGKTWTTSTIKKATYSTTLSSNNNGRYFRCVVKDKNGNKVTSKVVSMKIVAAPKITSQPSNVSAKVDDTVSFRVKAEGEGLTYQWYMKKAGEKSFAKWNKKTAATVSTPVYASWNGAQFYCEIKDAHGNTVKTNTVTLKVEFKITKQPENVAAAVGDKATFTMKASGTGVSYQWYYKKADASGWTKWNGKTGTSASLTVYKSWNGAQFYCVVTDASGKTLKSDAVKMTVTSESAS